MRDKELYNRTVFILIDAYLNDTLQSGNPCGCAVGNIIAYNLRIPLVKDVDCVESIKTFYPDVSFWIKWKFDILPQWDFVIHDSELKSHSTERKIQILSTGYSSLQLFKIERAFEDNYKGETKEERIFNALCATIDMLGILHNDKVENSLFES